MDKIETTTEIQEENQPTKSLGELLKSYRESAAMDYDQAANTLCLTVTTLQALENEQFDLLPEAPYIRGYLRSYAKLANVSSAEAIARYEEIRGGTSTAANLQYNFSPTSSVESIIKPPISPLLMRFGLIAVVILSLAVISMLPDVREWSTSIWTNFSQETQLEQEQMAEGFTKTSENPANTSNSNLETSTTIATNTTQTNTPASTQATTENPNTVPETQAALNNMDGNINRNNQLAVEKNTSTDSTNKHTSNTQDVVPQNTENTTVTVTDTAIETTPQIESPTVATHTPTATPTATPTPTPAVSQNANTNANTPESPPIAANTAATVQVVPIANETRTHPDGTIVASTTNTPQNTPDSNANTILDTATEGENADAETSAEALSNEVSIKLVFTKEVWMRVDSQKQKVFSGLKKEGDTEEFKASKPLSFKVGNAPGVEIYINGQRYDQTPHTRGAVSRFKIEDTP